MKSKALGFQWYKRGSWPLPVMLAASLCLGGCEAGTKAGKLGTRVAVRPPARTLSFTQQPSSSATSQAVLAVQPVVAVVDSGGSPVSTTTNPVVLTLTSADGATLSGTTSKTVVAGVADFTGLGLSIDKAGTYTLTATLPDSVVGTFTTVSTSIVVSAGAASKFAFSVQPSASSATGVSFEQQPMVVVQDAFGNQVSSVASGCVVTMSLTGGEAGDALGGSSFAKTVSTAGEADFATLPLKVDRIGTTSSALTDYQLTATASGTCAGLTAAQSDAFTITMAGKPTQLALVQAPSTAALNEVWSSQPIVKVLDADGNLVASDNTTRVIIEVMAGSPGGTLSGSTSIAVQNGVATFTGLKITSGSAADASTATTPATPYLYQFRGVNAPLTISSVTNISQVITSNGFTPAGLQFKTPPVNTATINEQMPSVEVKVVDANGYFCFNDNSTYVRLGFYSQLTSGGAMNQSGLPLPTTDNFTVQGVDAAPQTSKDGIYMTATAQVVNGVATFGNLSFTAANAHQIAAVGGSASGFDPETSQTLDGALTDAFAISSHGSSADHIVFSTQPSDVTAGSGWDTAPVVAVTDAFGNVMTNDSSSIITLECIQTIPCTLLGDHLSKKVTGGKADFTGENLRMGVDTTGVILKATASSSPALPITTVNSSSFNENAP